MSRPASARSVKRVPRALLAMLSRRAQYSGTGPEGLAPRAASGCGGGRLCRPGAMAGPDALARRDPRERIPSLRISEARA